MKPEWMGPEDEGQGEALGREPDQQPDFDQDGELDPELERELAAVLGRRTAVPEGFADRVLARADAERPRERVGARLLRWPGRQGWPGWAVAAGLLVSVAAGGGAWEREQAKVRQEAEARRCARATAQFDAAERITDQALDRVRAQMERVGVPAEAAGNAVGR